MVRHRGALRQSFGALVIVTGVAGLAPGQQAAPPSVVPGSAADVPRERPEVVMIRALRANPLTAPYAINTSWKDGAVVLSGRVGTKQVHDAAVQMAIAFGFRVRDDLVIDTAETFRVAMSATPSMTGYGALAPNLSASYYVYPQPLFGRLDDPFFGMDPPLLSFAPWWRPRRDLPMAAPTNAGPAAVNASGAPMAPNPAYGPTGGARATSPAPAPMGGVPANANPATGAPGTDSWSAPNPAGGGQPAAPAPAGAMELPPPKGDIEITVDAAGQVFLRGVVASEEVAREIEQTAWSVPGVSRVVTRFQVRPRRSETATPEEPPPPPQPVPVQPDRLMVPPRRDPNATPPPVDRTPEPPRPAPPGGAPRPERDSGTPAPGDVPRTPDATSPAHPRPGPIAVVALDTQRLTQRVIDSLKRRPALAAEPIQVRTSGDAILLSGKVPTAYEAMLAYRAAQQTPGVRDVVDRLEFLVPDEDHPNPLVRKGRPEDIEPYLIAQMTRHLGELAHIDNIRARGDHLEIRGTLLNAADKDRVLAILRSIPVLHGFKLDATLTAD